MLETAITLLESIFFGTTFVGQDWIMKFILIIGTMALITRHPKDWAGMALPVMIGWEYFGADIPLVFFSAGVLLFVVDALSIEVISSAISGASNNIGDFIGKRITKEGRMKTAKQRMDVKEEMEKLEGKILLSKGKLNDKELKRVSELGQKEDRERKLGILRNLAEQKEFKDLKDRVYPEGSWKFYKKGKKKGVQEKEVW